jgi:hypothetical protein
MPSKLFVSLVFASAVIFSGTTNAEDRFDMAIEAVIASDGMDTGVTYTDHKPAYSLSIEPSYGIFYGTLFAERLDYGVDDPTWANVKASIGARPVFGNLEVDFNLQRRFKLGELDGSSNRWLPYVTGTYKFNEEFSAALGTGYYAYDHSEISKSFWEIYGAVDVTPFDDFELHGEFSYNPKSDFEHNDALELIGSATVTLPHNFEVVGTVGYEDIIQNHALNYTWYEAALNYNFNEHATIGLKAHGNNLTAVGCEEQANTDCANSIFATLVLRGKLSDMRN